MAPYAAHGAGPSGRRSPAARASEVAPRAAPPAAGWAGAAALLALAPRTRTPDALRLGRRGARAIGRRRHRPLGAARPRHAPRRPRFHAVGAAAGARCAGAARLGGCWRRRRGLEPRAEDLTPPARRCWPASKLAAGARTGVERAESSDGVVCLGAPRGGAWRPPRSGGRRPAARPVPVGAPRAPHQWAAGFPAGGDAAFNTRLLDAGRHGAAVASGQARACEDEGEGKGTKREGQRGAERAPLTPLSHSRPAHPPGLGRRAEPH